MSCWCPPISDVVPVQVSTQTQLTRAITLNTPLISSAMDTVTESRMAIAMAQQGGIGIVHRNLSIADQAGEIDKVKRSESGMIVDPVTIGPDKMIGDALDVMRRYKISGVPVTQGKRLVGILTNRDLRFETRTDIPIGDVMTKENLITVPVGTTLEEAELILHKHRVEKLLVVNDQYELKGLITVKDIQKKLKYPNASKDDQGRLRVGGAIGATGDFLERAAELVRNRADVLAIDSAHGHSSRVLEAVREVKKRFPDVALLAGNVATYEGAMALIDAGADAIKVGIGPGSICTTRMVTGAGMPQITAIAEAYRAAQKHGIPVIADGGIKYSGEITKAIAAGASSVMIGSLFAGVDESPGETILYQGRSFKSYRGMGSLTAMSQGSGERYFQGSADLAIAESGPDGRGAARARQREPAGQVCSRRHRGTRALPRTARGDGLPARGRLALRHGLPGLRHDRGAAGEGEVRAHLRRRPARESRARRDHHPRGAQLPCRVAARGLRFWVSAWWPVAVGIAVIAVESTKYFGADHTSHPLRVLFEALFGPVSDARWELIHHYIRKSGHFLGYGALGLAWLRAWWMSFAAHSVSSSTPDWRWPAQRWWPAAMSGTRLSCRTGPEHRGMSLLDCCGALVMQWVAFMYFAARAGLTCWIDRN